MTKVLGQINDNRQQILNQQKSSINKDRPWYIMIIPFENGSSLLSIFVKTFFSIAITYISLLYAQLLFYPHMQQQNQIIRKIIFLTKEHIQLQILLIVFPYIIGIASLLIILFIHLKLVAQNSFLYSIIQPLAGILPLLPLLGMLISSISIICRSYFATKLISLIFTSSIAIFIDVFLQCGNNSEDLLFSYNNFFLILSRIITSIQLIISAIEYYLQEIYIIQWVSMAAFIIGIYYYCKKGFRSYRHQITQQCLLITTAQFLSISISIFILPYTNLHLAQTIFTSVFLAKIISLITSKIELNLISKQNLTIQQVKLFAEIFNNTNDGLSIQETAVLKGLLLNHSSLCNNPACFSKKSNVFCPNVQSSIKSSLKNDDSKFDSLFQYYIKCLYQSLMINQSSWNAEIVLSYCEFLCYQMKILLPIHPHLHYLYSSKLNADQQYRLYHLLKAIKKKMKHIMIGVKDLQLEKVITIQQLNDRLLQLIKNYIRFNYRFWIYSQQRYQPKDKILQWTNKQYQMLEIINEKMEESKQYFNINAKLKRIYSFSQIFLHNYHKKQRHQTVLQKILFKSSEQASLLPFEKPSSQNIALTAYFDNNSIIINTQFVQNQLLIRQMSKSSKSIIGFSEQQLVSCNLSIILPDYLSHHSDLFQKWTQYGQINHQKTLHQQKCHCRNKFNRLLQVNKSYKTYIDIEGTIRFVCLLEVNDVQPAILICPQKAFTTEQTTNHQNFYQYSEYLFDFLNRKQIKNHHEYCHQILQKIDLLKINQQSVNRIQIQKHYYQLTINKINNNQASNYYSINFITGSTFSYRKADFQSFKQETLKSKDYHLEQRNIFTKQQIYQPVQSTAQTSNINRLPCLLNLVIAIIILISSLVSFHRYNQLQIFIDQQVFMIRLQKYPYMLGINYYKAIMQIDEERQLDNIIQQYSAQFIEQISNQLFLLSYYDPQILLNDQDIIIQRGTQQITYQSKEIIYVLASFASTFNSYNSSYDKNQYEIFNQILLPFFKTMKNIKQSLFQKYDVLFDKMYITNITFLAILIISQIIVIIILILSFKQSKKKLMGVLKIIIDPRHQQIIKIKYYWKNLTYFFQKTFLINDEEYDKNEQLNTAEIQIHNLSQNKMPNLTKAIVITIISFLVQLSMVISIQYSSISTTNQIYNFQSQIQPIISFYPSGDVISYYIMQKRYNQSALGNNITNSDGFLVSLKQLQIMKSIQYISKATDPQSPFYHAYKNFFFDNPCQTSPKIYAQLGISDWQCLNFQSGKLASGLGVFNSHIFQKITKYIKSQSIMQNKQINEFTQSLIIMNAYLQQLIKIWMIQCKQKLSNAKSKLLYFNSLLVTALVAIYIVIIRIYLIPKLKNHQNLYKEVYRNFVTKEQISNSKIMQSQLRTLGFIKKL